MFVTERKGKKLWVWVTKRLFLCLPYNGSGYLFQTGRVLRAFLSQARALPIWPSAAEQCLHTSLKVRVSPQKAPAYTIRVSMETYEI